MNKIVRKATISDVQRIHGLLQQYADHGRLLPRPSEEILEGLDSFLVSEQDHQFAGCVSLEVFTHELGEVRSLAVNPIMEKSGHGQSLVRQVEVAARTLGLKRLMALTYVPGFFQKLGFRIVSMNSLPEKVFGICVTCPKFDRCDEIAMVKSLSTN